MSSLPPSSPTPQTIPIETSRAGRGKRSTPRLVTGHLSIIVLMAGILPLLCLGALAVFYDIAYLEKAKTLLGDQTLRSARAIDSFLAEKISSLLQEASFSPVETLAQPNILRDRLLALQHVHPGLFTDLDLLNASGQVIAHAGAHPDEPDQSKESWFQQAVTRPTLVSGISSGNSPVFVSVRIPDQKTAWVLRAHLDPRQIVDKIRVFYPGGSGNAFILGQSGTFGVAAADQDSTSLATAQSLSRQVFPENRPTVVEMDDARGEAQWYACAPLRTDGSILVFRQPKSEALGALGTIRILTAAAILLGGLGIATTALIAVRRKEDRLRKAELLQQQMQRQMVEAGKLASIGELAANIAHEINNPLAIMMENSGWIEDLLKSDDPQSEENMTEIHASLKTIVTQGHRCRDITQKLLNFARKTDSMTPLVQVHALLQDIVGFTRHKAKQQGVAVTLDLGHDLGEVVASATELQQVILNLVNNAIDAIAGPGGRVLLRARQDSDYISIDVEDTGQGIPADVLPRIFEPFFTTKPMGKGTGLGLAICRDILAGMGASISVDSVPGHGTAFHVRLPRHAASDHNL